MLESADGSTRGDVSGMGSRESEFAFLRDVEDLTAGNFDILLHLVNPQLSPATTKGNHECVPMRSIQE